MSLLVDTNVLSELLRREPHVRVRAWFAAQPRTSLHTSAVTQAEMMLGARLLPAGRRRESLETAMAELFGLDFAGRVLPFDHRAAAVYAEVVALRREAGRPVTQFDAQIAAIALAGDLRLATRNTDDFTGLGLDLVDPWG